MPRILLYADEYNGRVGIAEPYIRFLEQFGDVILVMANNDIEFWLQHGDILAMPGGADVNPLRYGEAPRASGRPNAHYEFLDATLLDRWIQTQKPIIGICRGMQSLNVALGGTLHQDIRGHVGDAEKRGKADFDLYSDIEGYEIYETNSFHHQGIRDLAPHMEMIAWGPIFRNCPSIRGNKKPIMSHLYEMHKKDKTSPGILRKIPEFKNGMIHRIDGETQYGRYYVVPEIIKHATLPYIGFQYHPEEMNCELAIKLINEHILRKEENEEEIEQHTA